MSALYQHLLDLDLTTGAFFSNDPTTRPAAYLRSHGRASFGFGSDHNGHTDDVAKSDTEVTIGTGIKTFSNLTGRVPGNDETWLARFAVGKTIKVLASESNWMEGVIMSRTTTQITISASRVSGAGAHSDWHLGTVTGGNWEQGFDSGGLLPRVTEWDYLRDQAGLSVIQRNRTAVGAGALVTGTGGPDASNGIGGHFTTAVRGGNSRGWALFAEAVRLDAAAGRAKGLELGAATMTPIIADHPALPRWPSIDKIAVGLWLAAGCDTNVFGQSYATQAHVVTVNNGAVAQRGLVFREDSIKREGQPDNQVVANKGWDDSDAIAVAMAYRHMIEWYSRDLDPSLTPPARVANVRFGSRVANPDVRYRMLFTDGALDIAEDVSGGNSLFRVAFRGDAENYLIANAGGSGQSPFLTAGGPGANIPIELQPKGTGWVRIPIGNVQNFADDAAAATGGLSVGAFYRTGSTLKIRVA